MQYFLLSSCMFLTLGLAETATAEPVDSLPLQRGFYVNADITCADADNSALYLVTGEGINSAQAACTIASIEQTGPTRFVVTGNCTELASGGELGEAVTTYDIPDDRTYGFVDGDKVVGTARFCEQAELPEPWHSNDISDLLE